MTENEAIEIIKKNYPKRCQMVNGIYKGGFDDTDCELGQAFNMAINALEEVQQYREIGTVDECRAAVEKQTAKKPENKMYSFYPHSSLLKSKYGVCPDCKSMQVDDEHCANCGQKLDWSEEE